MIRRRLSPRGVFLLAIPLIFLVGMTATPISVRSADLSASDEHDPPTQRASRGPACSSIPSFVLRASSHLARILSGHRQKPHCVGSVR